MPTRLLFTTACCEQPYDYIASNTIGEASPRLRHERRMSYGLRFLQANVPEITILEYPTWTEYLRTLKLGWDVVGYSFYANEIPEVEKMVREARRAGIRELWGGNYGVLTPRAATLFDRVAVGYAEQQVAGWLGTRSQAVSHPLLLTNLELGTGLGLLPLGVLFTVRGCNRGCTFCQTPVFCGRKVEPIPIESLAEVIEQYRRLRVGAILVLDECFGSIPKHAGEVVSLLDESALPWLPMTRVDILSENLAQWGRRGLAGALLGIESFQETHLRRIKKGANPDLIWKLVERLHSEDRIVVGYYMIGFEDDTPESLAAEMRQLADLKLDIAQVCILTPFHKTKMWESLATYGIDDDDLSKFDGKHLVWKHPNFEPGQLETILQQFFSAAFPPDRDVEAMRRFGRYLIRRVGLGAGLSYLGASLLQANSARRPRTAATRSTHPVM